MKHTSQQCLYSSASSHLSHFSHHICRPGSTRFDSARQGFCISGHNCLKVRLKPITSLSRSPKYYRRITANKMSPLIQFQTRFIHWNFFTIKAPPLKLLSWSSVTGNVVFSAAAVSKHEPAEGEHNETVKHSRCLKEQTGREKLKRFS